jgi:hypothetical protein
MLKPFLMGSAMLLAAALPAGAQDATLVDGTQTDEILNVARGFGEATMESSSDGSPRIKGEIDGVTYHVFFLNCDEGGKSCEDLNFYAGFLDNKQTFETINAWNRDRRFGKAYLDDDLDAVIEFDVNLEFGVSPKNLDASFSLWSLLLDRFAIYIGHK